LPCYTNKFCESDRFNFLELTQKAGKNQKRIQIQRMRFAAAAGSLCSWMSTQCAI